MNRKYLIIAMLLLAVIVLAGLGYTWYRLAHPTFHGSLITPPAPAADFSLTSQTGSMVKLADFRGKYILVYFGFTNCTSECPLTMGFLKQMHDHLGSLANQTQVIMISTDPARDTPDALGAFLSHFDPSFIGLTASKDVLQPVWSAYGVTVLDNGETHSSYTYLIDPQGNLIATYPLLQNADGITSDIRNLLRGK
jgi:cytochrome oxidase Cu insertion factor (SCO1/SenC/PrrC family)